MLLKDVTHDPTTANCVHQHVRIRMPIQTFAMWNFDAAENEFAATHQSVHVITNPNSNHAQLLVARGPGLKEFVPRLSCRGNENTLRLGGYGTNTTR